MLRLRPVASLSKVIKSQILTNSRLWTTAASAKPVHKSQTLSISVKSLWKDCGLIQTRPSVKMAGKKVRESSQRWSHCKYIPVKLSISLWLQSTYLQPMDRTKAMQSLRSVMSPTPDRRPGFLSSCATVTITTMRSGAWLRQIKPNGSRISPKLAANRIDLNKGHRRALSPVSLTLRTIWRKGSKRKFHRR